MKQSARKIVLAFLTTVTTFSPSQTRAQQLITYCRQTQSDDCIQVDSSGFWWDKEPGLPARKTSRKLPVNIFGKTRVVRFDNTYYCTHSSMQVSRSYVTCSAKGWVFQAN